jgi:hypothetical protein
VRTSESRGALASLWFSAVFGFEVPMTSVPHV